MWIGNEDNCGFQKVTHIILWINVDNFLKNYSAMRLRVKKNDASLLAEISLYPKSYGV